LNNIKVFNADAGNSYKKGVNQFTDKSVEELKTESLGGSKKTAKGALYRSLFTPTSSDEISPEELAELPTSVDWRTQNVVSPVKDQGHCGSCWAFSTAASIESHAAIASGHLKTLSTQQLVSCMSNTYNCGG
jgi:cathepsin L